MRQARYRIGKIQSGFTVAGTGTGTVGGRVTVACAYDIRRGNALKKYKSMDFAFGRDVDCRAKGLTIESAEANKLVAQIVDPHFEIKATGFDENRNLVVKVLLEELGVDT